jgi:hypothetical protein
MEALDKNRNIMEQNNRIDKPENQKKLARIEWPELKFKCPECGEDELLEMGAWGYQVKFFMDGRFELGKMVPYGGEEYFCCAACGYELHDPEGWKISHENGVIRWLLERYTQELIKKLR